MSITQQSMEISNRGIRTISIPKRITSSAQLLMAWETDSLQGNRRKSSRYVLERYHHESLDELLNRCNEYMVQKRGAAVAIVRVNYKEGTIEYSCVGNVRMYILHGCEKMIYPLPVMGYLSGRPQKMNTQTYKYDVGDLFFLHSDGIYAEQPESKPESRAPMPMTCTTS